MLVTREKFNVEQMNQSGVVVFIILVPLDLVWVVDAAGGSKRWFLRTRKHIVLASGLRVRTPDVRPQLIESIKTSSCVVSIPANKLMQQWPTNVEMHCVTRHYPTTTKKPYHIAGFA